MTEISNYDDFVAGLTDEGREALSAALRTHKAGEADAAILAKIKEVLQEDAPGRKVRGVVFRTMDYDNGDFLTSDGEVFYTNGEHDALDFSPIDEIFTDEYGSRGSDFALAVNVQTGEMDADDYSDNSYAWLGVKVRAGG